MRRFPTAAALALAAALLAARALPAGETPPAGGPRTFALRAGRVFTGEDAIEGGTVLVKDGKIAAVGREIEVPPGVKVHDLPGRSVIPGLIDPETTLAEGGQDTRRSISPDVLAADSWDFFADRRRLLAGGVTAVHVSPGASRLVSGQGMVVKTGGCGDDVRRRVLRERAGVRVALGEFPKNPPSLYDPPVPPSFDRPFEPLEPQVPGSRAGEFLALRDLLRRARAYAGALEEWKAGKRRAPEPDLEAAPLLDLVAGRDLLRVRADRAHDILRVLELGREMGVGLAIEGAREAHLVPEAIARARVPVIFRGEARPGRSKDEDITRTGILGRYSPGAPAALARHGVRVAIDSPTDAEVEDLLLEAAQAVREGLPEALALRAVTLTAAEILGVADRVGSIRPGKDADLVVLPGEGLLGAGGSPPRPEAVFIEGELVFSPGPREFPEGALAIRCGRILTGKEEIPGGIILVKDGKVLHVGPGILAPVPEKVPAIDASRETVIPGLIDCGSRAGAREEILLPTLADEGRGSAGLSGGGRSTYRVADAIDPADPALPLLLRSGITTVVAAPDPVGSVSGQLTALKLAGPGGRAAVLKDPAGLLFAAVRPDELQRAREYNDRWEAHERAAREAAAKAEKPPEKPAEKQGEKPEGKPEEKPAGGAKEPRPEPPQKDEALEPFRPLFQGKATALALARSRGEVESVLRELVEKHRLPAAIQGSPGLDDGAFEEIRRRGASLVLTGTELVVPQRPPEGPRNLPRLAAQAGVRCAVRSGAAAGARHLPVDVAQAVREGLDSREALRALTVHPARIFGIDDRVGSIEAGKDADLVFLTGDPFAVASRVLRVMVDGKVVFEEKSP